MLNMKPFVLILSVLFTLRTQANTFFSQDTTKKVPYTQDYILKEGIYYTFKQFLENNPIPKYKIVSKVPKDIPTYLTEVTRADTIYYVGENGLVVPLPTSQIWGYCENNTVFVHYLNKFNRVIVIGTIGFFMTQVTVTSTVYDDPYYSYYYDPFYYPISGSPRQVKTDEIRRYLIDFKTGEILPFNRSNLEILLSSDTELYTEYMSLSKRKRKKLMFLYLRRFNERNPLLLPEN